MDIHLVKARFETTLESAVFLARFVLGKIRIPECRLKMMLNPFEEQEDFADSTTFVCENSRVASWNFYITSC